MVVWKTNINDLIVGGGKEKVRGGGERRKKRKKRKGRKGRKEKRDKKKKKPDFQIYHNYM